jgi:hypothetical protein
VPNKTRLSFTDLPPGIPRPRQGHNVLGDPHASDTDLERYCLGMIQEGPELDALEEHLLIAGECVDGTLASDAYIDKIRAGLVNGDFGLRTLRCGKAAAQ